MPLTLLPASARTPKPWKNGGGVTTDVWVHPESASLEDFLARVSIAEVASDGPFSVFAGIDRTTAILDGAGFDLTFDGTRTVRLTREAAPLAYSGNTPAASRLINGPTTDLNAMSRQGLARHRMERLKLEGEMQLKVEPLTLFLVAEGKVQFEAGSQALRLGPLDACLVSKFDMLRLIPARNAVVFSVHFGL